MAKTIAFYDHFVSGHHVEYLFQVAKAKIELGIEDEYIFIVPRKAEVLLSELIDLNSLLKNKIRFHFLDQYSDDEGFSVSPNLAFYEKQLRILKEIIKIEHIDHCVFMLLNNYFQVVLGYWEARKLGCGLSGILMNPFGTHERRGVISLSKYLLSIRIYFQIRLMLFNPKLGRIFVIINENTTSLLNRLHFTNKFTYISDPVLELKHLSSLSEGVYKRIDSRIVFMVFGSLSKRKGIFTVLDALDMLTHDELNRIQVVFAGKLFEKDRQQFLKKFERIRAKDIDAVKLIDRYVAYKEIPGLFGNVDYVVMPYEISQASSGILGHSAYYGVPVIASGHGVVKEHIDEYSLGLAIKDLNANELSVILKEIADGRRKIILEKDKAAIYLNTRNTSFFGKRLLLNI